MGALRQNFSDCCKTLIDTAIKVANNNSAHTHLNTHTHTVGAAADKTNAFKATFCDNILSCVLIKTFALADLFSLPVSLPLFFF